MLFLLSEEETPVGAVPGDGLVTSMCVREERGTTSPCCVSLCWGVAPNGGGHRGRFTGGGRRGLVSGWFVWGLGFRVGLDAVWARR